jgi:CBS domain-containing protein
VREIMTGSPISINPSMTLWESMVLMSQNHIRHLPVVDNDVLLGVLSNRDVVNKLISDYESTIEKLENYISGTEYTA